MKRYEYFYKALCMCYGRYKATVVKSLTLKHRLIIIIIIIII